MKRKITSAVAVLLMGGGVVVAASSPAPAGDNAPITITKVVDGTIPASASFTIHVACTGTGAFVGQNPSADINFPGTGGTAQFNGVFNTYTGNCVFTETTTSGATPTYACSAQQASAATCGGGGASPATLNVNNPTAGQMATITVSNTIVTPAPVVTAPRLTG